MIETNQKEEEGRDLSEYLKRSFYDEKESEKIDIGEFNDFEL